MRLQLGTIGIALVATIACGTLEEEHSALSNNSSYEPPTLHSFNSAPTEVETGEQPRVWATPDLLTFFGDYEGSEQCISREVVIVNDTAHPVHVTRAYLEDDGSHISRSGSDFFEVAWQGDMAHLLPPQGQLPIEVQFYRSIEQRSASLVIETTHPDYPVLLIALTGKYFLGDDSW